MSIYSDRRMWAAVCKRGHILASTLDHPDQPVEKFCRYCGAPVITRCESCTAPLPGSCRGVLSPPGAPDSFCFECGHPHRWASREARVRHLENLLEFEDLDEATQLTVIEDLAVLAAPLEEVDEDARVAAGDRLRKLAPRMWETGKPVIQSVLTEVAKRRLGL